ncbi:MAG: hypothetical protein AB1704_20315 [Pseudomonadota bacterium]
MQHNEISNEAVQPEYVIFSRSEGNPDLDGGAGAFWSNSDGWVHFDSATRFSYPQHVASSLPTACGNDSKWITLDHARSIVGSDAEPPAAAFRFKVGDIVHWTNDYGAEWFGRRIVGIDHYATFGPRYFLDPNDAYWAPVHERNLAYETATSPELEAQLPHDGGLRCP